MHAARALPLMLDIPEACRRDEPGLRLPTSCIVTQSEAHHLSPYDVTRPADALDIIRMTCRDALDIIRMTYRDGS